MKKTCTPRLWTITIEKVDNFMQNNGEKHRSRAEFIDELIDIALQFYPRLIIIEQRHERRKRKWGRPRKIDNM